MELDEECKDCLSNSQLKKVERTQTDAVKKAYFRERVKALCANPPKNYCAPLLMRDIDGIHRRIFGCGIDYSEEKSTFNKSLLALEGQLFERIMQSADALGEALKYAGSANYIDFARLCDLDEGAVDYVIQSVSRTEIDKRTLRTFREKLQCARTMCVLHDNCGEIVLDKILIRVIRKLYPDIDVTSVVRGGAIINDATCDDAAQVGLGDYATVVDSGACIPGTYLKETSPVVAEILSRSDVVLAKGLGNLETLYGSGYGIFYSFNCKCRHIADRFNLPLWSAAFVYENCIQ